MSDEILIVINISRIGVDFKCLNMKSKRIFICPSIPEAENAGFVNQMFWLLCLTVLPSVVVVIYSCSKIYDYSIEMISLKELLTTFEPFENSKIAVTAMLNEMSGVVICMATVSSPDGSYPTMKEVFEKTDARVEDLSAITMSREGYQWVETKEELMHELRRFRLREEDFRKTNLMFVVGIYQELIHGMIFSPTQFILSKYASSIPMYTVVAENLLNSLINFGLVESLGMSYFLSGHLSDEERINFIEKLQVANNELKESTYLNPSTKLFWNHKENQLKTFLEAIQKAEKEILNGKDMNSFGPSRAANWLERSVLRSNILGELLKRLEKEMTAYLESKLADVHVLLVIHIATLCITALVCLPLSCLGSISTAKSLRSYIKLVEKKGLEIRKEKRKTERLLHEMLPKSMAFRLQKGEQIYAEQFQSVTIFFSDIADFTEISTRSVPIDIVSFLNDVYNFIDSLIVKYDVYKVLLRDLLTFTFECFVLLFLTFMEYFQVETINCVYMVSSGIPSRNGDRHCIEIARLSIDLIKACEDFVIPHLKNHKLQLRIGVHTGDIKKKLRNFLN